MTGSERETNCSRTEEAPVASGRSKFSLRPNHRQLLPGIPPEDARAPALVPLRAPFDAPVSIAEARFIFFSRQMPPRPFACPVLSAVPAHVFSRPDDRISRLPLLSSFAIALAESCSSALPCSGQAPVKQLSHRCAPNMSFPIRSLCSLAYHFRAHRSGHLTSLSRSAPFTGTATCSGGQLVYHSDFVPASSQIPVSCVLVLFHCIRSVQNMTPVTLDLVLLKLRYIVTFQQSILSLSVSIQTEHQSI